MTTIFAFSDAHLERRSLPLLPIPAEAEIVVCAGDIHEGDAEKGIDALARLADGRSCVLVLGNHDLYKRPGEPYRPLESVVDRFQSLGRPHGIEVLHAGRVIEMDGLVFTGTTLWGDWNLASRWASDWAIEENRALSLAKLEATGSSGPREYHALGLMPDDVQEMHLDEKDALAKTLAWAMTLAGSPDRVVCVTHHAPLARIADAYRTLPTVPFWGAAFYACDAFDELPQESRPGVWISGHVHRTHDFIEGGTRFVANPVEAPGFDAGLIIEIAAGQGE